MLGSIYHDIKIALKSHFWGKKHYNFVSLSTQRCYGRFRKICKPLVVYGFYCMALFHFQMQCHMIMKDTFRITLCMLGNFACIFVVCYFFKINIFSK